MSDLKLKNLCSIKGGSGFPEEYQGKAEGEYPFAKVSDMSLPGNERYILRTNNYVDEDLVRFMHFTVFPRGSVVFAKVGAAIFLNRRRILAQETILDNNMMGLLPYGVDVDFLYHFMQSVDLGYLVQPGALPSVNQEIIGEIELPEFTATEQCKIAKILTTVDNLIEKTEALIAKYQAIKQGMMHDLFTRGVDEHGHLRPPYDEAPELYKESELGWIPKEWKVVRCEEICEEIIVGIVIQPAQYYTSSGVPVLRSANVRETGIDPADLVYMSEESNRLLEKSMLKKGNVVTVRTGYPGTSCVVSAEFDGANCVDILISRPGPNIRSLYFATWINSDFGKSQVLRKQGGLAQQHFNVGELKELIVALPSSEEQERIETVLLTQQEKIDSEGRFLAKTKLLKTGLMQDLLTGKVRVKISEPAEAVA